jgi:hypothetical protein
MSRAGLSPSDPRQTFWPDPQRLTSAVWSAVPPLLFGLRLWVAVCLALYIARLELDARTGPARPRRSSSAAPWHLTAQG